MTRRLSLASFVLALALACGGPEQPAAAPASEPSTQPTADDPPSTVDPPADERYADAPPGTATIASLLMARHTEDLPTAETLTAHDGAEASLVWLGANGHRMVLRTRALGSLRFYRGDDARALLLGLLGDSEAHPALRASAVRGTGGFDLDADAELRAAVEALRGADDPRVAQAVDERLSD